MQLQVAQTTSTPATPGNHDDNRKLEQQEQEQQVVGKDSSDTVTAGFFSLVRQVMEVVLIDRQLCGSL